jgi:hypothetical protein
MGAPRPASRRELVTAAAVLIYMIIQVSIPVTHLRFRYDSPFAWKMYAYYRPAPLQLRLVLTDGRTQAWTGVPNRPRAAVVLRPEVDRARFVPPALCRQVPGIRAVESRTPVDATWRRFECP